MGWRDDLEGLVGGEPNSDEKLACDLLDLTGHAELNLSTRAGMSTVEESALDVKPADEGLGPS